MAGPWEKYAAPESGPWAKYGNATTEEQGNYDASPEEVNQMRKEFIRKEGTIKTRVKEFAKAASPIVRTTLEAGGALAGSVFGGTAGAAAGGIGAVPGAVAGGALGYAGGKNLADTYDEALGLKENGTIGDRMLTTAGDLATGATYEMAGPVVGKALSATAKTVGKVAKPVLGKLSGVGTETIEQGLKSGEKATGWNPLKSQTAYDKALRGEITGDEVVDSAKDALSAIKQQRASAYQSKLAEVEQATGPIDMVPLRQKLMDLMDQYKVKIDPTTGAIDTSRVPMAKKGRTDIEDVISTIKNWGSQAGDDTAVGLDTLKRQLDDFYSDSSPARQFVQSMKKEVNDTITSAVPAYGEMTKGYSQATNLIKDIESGLMLRKQGLSGRITADQTLKRLQFALRDDGIKKELLDVLGNKSGEDLMGAVAGTSANAVLPRGLAGTGPSLIGNLALAKFVNPQFWGVVVASSPRVQGEFLRLVGRARNLPPRYVEQAIKTIGIASRSGKDESKGATARIQFELEKLQKLEEEATNEKER